LKHPDVLDDGGTGGTQTLMPEYGDRNLTASQRAKAEMRLAFFSSDVRPPSAPFCVQALTFRQGGRWGV